MVEIDSVYNDKHSKLSTKAVIGDFVSGIIAGSFSTYIGYPLDFVKVRMQLNNQGMIQSSKVIYKEGGAREFFKGVLSPTLGNAPINALVFGGNGFSNKYIETHYPAMNEGNKLFISGCFGGLLSLLAFVPVEVIKIRI